MTSSDHCCTTDDAHFCQMGASFCEAVSILFIYFLVHVHVCNYAIAHM